MSGHSKWSTIKREKAATDRSRSHVFTKLGNSITLSVHEGGGSGNPEDNFKLRLAIEKAKEANMPKDNIQRAIDRGTGKLAGAKQLEEFLYEGYSPGGVAVLVAGVTDNKQRAVSEVKNAFVIRGGRLGTVGSVGYLFQKMGEIHLTKLVSYDQMLEYILEAGGEDVEEEVDRFVVYTKPNDLHKVVMTLTDKGQKVIDNGLIYKPASLVSVGNEVSGRVIELLTALEDLPDVHKVYANVEFRQ